MEVIKKNIFSCTQDFAVDPIKETVEMKLSLLREREREREKILMSLLHKYICQQIIYKFSSWIGVHFFMECRKIREYFYSTSKGQ